MSNEPTMISASTPPLGCSFLDLPSTHGIHELVDEVLHLDLTNAAIAEQFREVVKQLVERYQRLMCWHSDPRQRRKILVLVSGATFDQCELLRCYEIDIRDTKGRTPHEIIEELVAYIEQSRLLSARFKPEPVHVPQRTEEEAREIRKAYATMPGLMTLEEFCELMREKEKMDREERDGNFDPLKIFS